MYFSSLLGIQSVSSLNLSLTGLQAVSCFIKKCRNQTGYEILLVVSLGF